MMMAWKVRGLSHRPPIMASRPASIRLAIAISPSRDRSSTEPISRKYMRTGSSVRSLTSVDRSCLTGRCDAGDWPVVLFVVDRLGGGSFLDLFRVDNVHAKIGEHRHDVLDLVGRHLVGGQNFVQLVVSDIAARLRNLDETLYGGIQKIKDWAIGSFRSRCLLLFGFCRRCGHYALQKKRKTGDASFVPRLEVASESSCGAKVAMRCSLRPMRYGSRNHSML